MPVAKLKALNTTDVMKPEEGNDSLDTFIRQAIGKEPFLSFSRANDSPVQWIQLLHALDQQEFPGWPLLTPLKVQMQKCEKCSREFCSSINYRRHIRVHHRLKKLDKDSAKNRELLGAFWDKLSEDETKEILSFQDVKLEEVPGSLIVKSLTTLLRKPVISSLPQYCLRAASALLDIIQSKPSKFPLPSEELFGILDDASEKTFLCGAAISIQKYIFEGDAGKIGLETKNLVACTSFLVEQRLVKAWDADKDAEALRCQKLLVEEEEAAQRRQAELLERKRQKKLRQKEQKAKEQKEEGKDDAKVLFNDTIEAVTLAEESCTVSTSDSDIHGPSTPPDHTPMQFEPFQPHNTNDNADLEMQRGFDSGYADHDSGHKVERQTMQGNSRRHIVVSRWHMPPKSKWNHLPNGFHSNQNSQVPKLSAMQRHGSARDSKPLPMVNDNRKWARKLKAEYSGESLRTGVHKEANSQPDHNEKRKVLIGSISVTIGNCSQHESSNLDGIRADCLAEHQNSKKNNPLSKHNRADSGPGGTNRSIVKLWRPVSRNGNKGPMLIENGTREFQVDGLADKGEDHQTESGDGCLRSCTMESNCGGTENSSPGCWQFSFEEAKAFLAERWKEAIATDHVKLVLYPNSEQLGCTGVSEVAEAQPSNIEKSVIVGNADNQLVNGGLHESTTVGKVKFRTKPEKGVKLKYIPKQRTNT